MPSYLGEIIILTEEEEEEEGEGKKEKKKEKGKKRRKRKREKKKIQRNNRVSCLVRLFPSPFIVQTMNELVSRRSLAPYLAPSPPTYRE